ncbi:MAG: thiamine phosphate synthase [Alphaproteobacteria bacterium]|nr:thiamine phosphate synthase [Alphaproteobacteria bacterium]
MTKQPACRLYLITPPAIPDLDRFAATMAEALGAGDVAVVQLRLKDCPDAAILQAAQRLGPLAQSHGAAFLVNDLPDLAKACNADGVHVGQEDASYAEARRILGPKAIVGVTCHDSRHLAMEAGDAGADYVAFGAFYPTSTKEAKSRALPEILQWWRDVTVVPSVAIGGITAENAAPLVQAGADFLAVSSGVWAHPDGAGAGVQAMNEAIRKASS